MYGDVCEVNEPKKSSQVARRLIRGELSGVITQDGRAYVDQRQTNFMRAYLECAVTLCY